MRHHSTSAIILKRINFSEADRIITVLTKDGEKLRLMAKGVRKSTSKMAGGIELFSESEMQYIKGKGEIDTLISTRILKNFSQISTNLEATRAGYELISLIDHLTEHSVEPKYYILLNNIFEFLNTGINHQIARGIFYTKALEISGHNLNLSQDLAGEPFNEKNNYVYNFEIGRFEELPHGYSASVIKIIKLLSNKPAEQLAKISGMDDELPNAVNVLKSITEYYLHFRYRR